MFRIKHTLTLPLTLLALLFVPFIASSGPQPEPRETAMILFEKGQYDKALPIFLKLVYDYPYDYVLKYYAGASLIETADFGLEAEKNLLIASGKEVPVKVNYYLGILYHAKSDWNSAQRYYNRFRNNADTASLAKLRIDELSELCYKKINPFISEEKQSQEYQSLPKEEPAAASMPATVDSSVVIQSRPSTDTSPTTPDSLMAVVNHPLEVTTPAIIDSSLAVLNTPIVADSAQSADKASLTENIAVQVDSLERGKATAESVIPLVPVAGGTLPPISFIDFQINSRITYMTETMFKTEQGLSDYRSARDKQNLLDTLLHQLHIARVQYRQTMNPTETEALGMKISQLEGESLTLKRDVNDLFLKARGAEQEWWNKADFQTYETFTEERDSLLILKARMAEPIPEAVLPVVETPADTTMANAEDSGTEGTGDEELKEEADPDEIIYKIQLGAYKGAVPSSRKAAFTKISKLRLIDTYVNDEGVTVYTTGNLKNFSDAVKLQNQVRLEGIKDAFVIALKNGKRVSLPKEK